MSRCVKQPIGQKRLTNIAVVRLKKQGKRFEVACYKNKVANWRSGVETDLDEVLQTEAVFSNVSRGVLAKDEDLQAVFGTTNAKAVCLLILAEGNMQVSDRERSVEMGALFRDVAAAVASRCVNTSTRRPFTVSMVERALKAAGFSVDGKRPAKAQAGDAEALLSQRGLPIARARMRLRAVVHPDAAAQLGAALEAAAVASSGKGGSGGVVLGAEEEGEKEQEEEAEEEEEEDSRAKKIVVESRDMSMDGSAVTFVFLAEPGLFREIHAAVEGLQGPTATGGGGNGAAAARLEVVDVAATDAAGAAAASEAAARTSGGGGASSSALPPPSASSVASGLRSLRMSPSPDDAKGGEAVGKTTTAMTTAASTPNSSTLPAAAVTSTSLYPRGQISSLPAELAGPRRKDLFDALDKLQEGWTVELLSRGGGSGGAGGEDAAVVDAVFYSPAGEKVGTFAAARRIALAASKAK